MNKSVKAIALCGVLVLTAASCQKENLIENPGVVTQARTVRTVSYTVDGVRRSITLVGDDAWHDFLHHMLALAEEGHAVSFRNGENTAHVAAAKETVTYTTQDKDAAFAWCDAMYQAGYSVTIDYNPSTNTYYCTATK